MKAVCEYKAPIPVTKASAPTTWRTTSHLPRLGSARAASSINSFSHYFAHPDGSFGGLYGSRCTRFTTQPVCSLSAMTSRRHRPCQFHGNLHCSASHCYLSAMDEPNFIPMFNAYTWAATQRHQQSQLNSQPTCSSFHPLHRQLPLLAPQLVLIDRGLGITASSAPKGGVVYLVDQQQVLIDSGLVMRDRSGQLGSTQGIIPTIPSPERRPHRR